MGSSPLLTEDVGDNFDRLKVVPIEKVFLDWE